MKAILRAKLDDISTWVAITDTGKCTLGIVKSETVRIWAPVLESSRVVDLPEPSQTSRRLIVRSRATVLGGAEFGARGHATNCVPLAIVNGQLRRTLGIDVRATGRFGAVIMVVGSSVERSPNWVHGHGHIVAIYKTDVVKVHSLVLVKGNLGQSCRKAAPGSVTFHLTCKVGVLLVGKCTNRRLMAKNEPPLTAIARFTVSPLSITVGSTPNSTSPTMGHLEASRPMGVQGKASICWRARFTWIAGNTGPDFVGAVVDNAQLMSSCACKGGSQCHHREEYQVFHCLLACLEKVSMKPYSGLTQMRTFIPQKVVARHNQLQCFVQLSAQLSGSY